MAISDTRFTRPPVTVRYMKTHPSSSPLCLCLIISLGVFSGATDSSQAQETVASQAAEAELAQAPVRQPPLLDRKVEISERELAALVGPRALSRAFRFAAKRASPGVVTVFCYGQGGDKPETDQSESSKPDIPGPPLPDAPLPEDESEQDPPGEDEDSTDPPDPNEAPDSEEESPEDAVPPNDELGPKPPIQSPDDPSARLTGLGSGVIVDPTGLVLTNQHVVRGASKVVVQMPDETEYSAVKIEGDSDSDIAILRIESSMPLPSVEVGNSDQLDIGDWVLAIGSPFKLDATVSAGIISAKNRKLSRIRRGTLLQTDAAINPGNSGGPMIDLDGRVVGINTAIATRNGGNQGIGFAVPINQAIWVARELDQHGKVRRAAMGIRLAELNPNVARKFDLKPYAGVMAYQVVAESAADKAGMKNFDVITEFAGSRIRKTTELQEIVERLPIGSTQTVRILRDGKELSLDILLAPLEDVTAEVKATE